MVLNILSRGKKTVVNRRRGNRFCLHVEPDALVRRLSWTLDTHWSDIPGSLQLHPGWLRPCPGLRVFFLPRPSLNRYLITMNLKLRHYYPIAKLGRRDDIGYSHPKPNDVTMTRIFSWCFSSLLLPGRPFKSWAWTWVYKEPFTTIVPKHIPKVCSFVIYAVVTVWKVSYRALRVRVKESYRTINTSVLIYVCMALTSDKTFVKTNPGI